ncbi:hypothetical protein [Flindersiella endophytica]
MITLHIEHEITDYATWKQAFDSFADVRRHSGVLAHRIRRPQGNEQYVLIDLDFGTGEEASKFLDFLVNNVWSTPANAPALVGAPQTSMLELIEQQP